MRKYSEVQETRLQLESIICDRCKDVHGSILEMQEFFSMNQDVGYGGILGDGNKVRLDLCQHCFKEMFEGIYRIEGNYILGDL